MGRATRNTCKCGFSYLGEADRLRRICPYCALPRVPKRKSKALALPYEHYIAIQGGEFCGVCGVGPSEMRRLDRDHCHRTDTPRGLLCHRHNRLLSPRMGWTVDALLKAAAYLGRHERGNEQQAA